jgi:hypothetical protein
VILAKECVVMAATLSLEAETFAATRIVVMSVLSTLCLVVMRVMMGVRTEKN